MAASFSLVLPGVPDPQIAEPDPELRRYVNAQVLSANSVPTTGRDATAEQTVGGVLDTDVLELRYAGGARQWVSVGQLREDLNSHPAVRSSGPGEVRVPAVIPSRAATRGGLDTALVLKGLKLVRIDPVGMAADQLVDKVIIKDFEEKAVPHTGLRAVGSGFTLREPTASLTGDTPSLLFIHGTASSTMGSFGGIVAGKDTGLLINPPITPEWRDLVALYRDRMFAYEHHTLSVSPIANAIELAQALPDRARLHLVTHSRGGLIGELLCLDGDTTDAQALQLCGRKDVEAELSDLLKILAGKKFQIERFVRVACPALGTTLASKRADTTLSIIFNLLEAAAPTALSPLLGFVKAVAIQTAKMRTDPSRLPGLEAQMPSSPLVRILNAGGLKTSADLGVIAGDAQAGGVMNTLTVLAADAFYREDHDLVVNTDAMYGGMGREGAPEYYFERGRSVNHFNYFGNDSTRARLVEWLRGDKSGFKRFTPGDKNLRASTQRSADKRPVIVLVPGFMASTLVTADEKNEPVWLNFARLGRRGVKQLGGDLTAGAVIAEGYRELAQELEKQGPVIPFAYDWRASAFDSAKELAATCGSQLDAGREVRIVADWSGGLVVLAMIQANTNGIWDELRQKNARVVLIGAPINGTWDSVRFLAGADTLARMLRMLDYGESEEMANMFAKWKGLLELLPTGTDSANAFDPRFWRMIPEAPSFDAQLLADARAARERMRTALDGKRMIYIAGKSAATVSGYHPDNAASRWIATGDGDGRVTYASEPWKLDDGSKLPVWYADAPYGSLLAKASYRTAIADLVRDGRTGRLASEPPASTEAALLVDRPLLFPNERSLLAAALGRDAAPTSERETAVLKLSVLHADLQRASYPLTVGHYQGDTIVHAESVVDRALRGALSARFNMGVYPGEENTFAVVESRLRPPGALVVGLGEVGRLTADKLRQGVYNAALGYAMSVAEGMPDAGHPCARKDKSEAPPWRSAAISSLLIGTYGEVALTTAESVTAIVQAVVEANRALRSQNVWNRVRIDRLEFVELYETRAAEAMNVACSVQQYMRIRLDDSELIETADAIDSHPSGRLQPPPNQYETGWWRRIQVNSKPVNGGYEFGFNEITDRARTEDTPSVVQKTTLDAIIGEAISKPDYNEALSVAMYELVLPRLLKERAVEQAPLLLEVDNISAQIPWEMMAARSSRETRVIAARTGMLRQFKSKQYRVDPRMTRRPNALVIGDPAVNRPEEYPSLEGAFREAGAVTNLLSRSGYEVDPVLRRNALDTVTSLFTKDYKIIHIAAHGEYRRNGRTGIVLGNGAFLTAAEFSQMRMVPELVFLNCCHLGRIDAQERSAGRLFEANVFAASVAEQLIDNGVRVVVVAGWAVNDEAAQFFAETLYTHLLDGEPFGSAVQTARKDTFERYSSSNTWAAYQCYGNPGFVLKVGEGPRQKRSKDKTYRSRGEVLNRCRNIRSQAESGDEADPDWTRNQRDRLLKELIEIADRQGPRWPDGEVYSAIADAVAAFADFDCAIRIYEQAIKDEKGGAPIRAYEQLANLRERQANKLFRSAAALAEPERSARHAEALEQIRKALETMDLLIALGDTAERRALKGAALKRRAAVLHPTERSAGFAEAAREYESAYGRARLPYTGLNWITMRYLAGEQTPELKGDAKDLVEQTRDLRNSKDLWERVALPDAMVIHALIGGDLLDTVDAIKDAYCIAVQAEGNAKNLASVWGQVEYLREMLADRQPIVAALNEILTVRNT